MITPNSPSNNNSLIDTITSPKDNKTKECLNILLDKLQEFGRQLEKLLTSCNGRLRIKSLNPNHLKAYNIDKAGCYEISSVSGDILEINIVYNRSLDMNQSICCIAFEVLNGLKLPQFSQLKKDPTLTQDQFVRKVEELEYETYQAAYKMMSAIDDDGTFVKNNFSRYKNFEQCFEEQQNNGHSRKYHTQWSERSQVNQQHSDASNLKNTEKSMLNSFLDSVFSLFS